MSLWLIIPSKLFACKCTMLPSAPCICAVVTPQYIFFFNNTLAASGTPAENTVMDVSKFLSRLATYLSPLQQKLCRIDPFMFEGLKLNWADQISVVSDLCFHPSHPSFFMHSSKEKVFHSNSSRHLSEVAFFSLYIVHRFRQKATATVQLNRNISDIEQVPRLY